MDLDDELALFIDDSFTPEAIEVEDAGKGRAVHMPLCLLHRELEVLTAAGHAVGEEMTEEDEEEEKDEEDGPCAEGDDRGRLGIRSTTIAE